MTEQNYFAFISYSRKDKKIATWLHKKLEGYAYPQILTNENQRPPHDKYLRPIFLDTKDMQVEERPFTDRIKAALERSRFLLLICSRKAAVSSFVKKEVDYFLEHHMNNYSLIVPMFIDEVESENIPEQLIGTSIMHRHFPIYNTQLSEDSEANSYCFYQIAAYMLGVNFSDIYNRYEQDSKKKTRQERKRIGFILVALIIVVAALGFAVYESQLRIQKGRELIRFEKKVFPAAVVFGYEENFLTPVIRYLRERNDNFKVYILMPTSYRGLHHQDRIADINYTLKKKLGIDSLNVEYLPTSIRRGNRVFRLMKDGKSISGIYLDFASTTTSFFKIAEYKKGHPAYRHKAIDDIICEYSDEFIVQTKEKLEDDSVYVVFVTDKEQLINEIIAQRSLAVTEY